MFTGLRAPPRSIVLGVYAAGAVLVTALVAWCTTVVGVTLLAIFDASVLDGSGQPEADRSRARGAATMAVETKAPAQLEAAASPQPSHGPVLAYVQPQSAPAPIRPAVALSEDDAAAAFHNGEGGTFRTYCVRLCDGYFWPMSFSTTSDQFERDQARCEASCSSPARLFVHAMPGGSPQSMTSLEGLPYTGLRTAFLFRTKFDQNCKCRAHPWEEQAMDRHRLFAAAEAARKGDVAAREEVKVLAAKVKSSLGEQTVAKAVASKAVDRELAALSRSVGVRPVGGESAAARTAQSRNANVADAGRRGGNMMRLGATSPPVQKSNWRPANGSGRPWQDRAFNGN